MVVLINVVISVLLFLTILPPLTRIRPHLPTPKTRAYTRPLEVRRAAPAKSNPKATVESRPNTIEFYVQVAARSAGEGSFAVPEIACTIKNRLRVSRASLHVVLRAYHARDVRPSKAHVEAVRQVFEGLLPCPPTWWYALSLQDTHYWKPHNRAPVAVIKRSETSQILIFDR